MVEIDRNRIECAVKEILIAIGEDPDKGYTKNTPKRVADMYVEFFENSKHDNSHMFKNSITLNSSMNGNEVIIVKGIPIYSMCEHHFLPFHGYANIAYIPGKNKNIIGFSKIYDIFYSYSRKLQLQEKLTIQIAESFLSNIKPAGVFVSLNCEHLCVTMRNVSNAKSKIITNVTRGNMQYNEIVDIVAHQ